MFSMALIVDQTVDHTRERYNLQKADKAVVRADAHALLLSHLLDAMVEHGMMDSATRDIEMVVFYKGIGQV